MRPKVALLLFPFAVLVGLAITTPVLGKVYYTAKQLLMEHFHDAHRVSHQRIAITGPLRAKLERKLGRKLPKTKTEYVVYIATRGDHVDGYAVFDQEPGQHQLIDFATFFDAAGTVTRTEVVAYREGYGAEIRRESFRQQFVGRNAASGFQLGSDIDAISGATISSESMSRAVQRAALVLEAGVLSAQDQ